MTSKNEREPKPEVVDLSAVFTAMMLHVAPGDLSGEDYKGILRVAELAWNATILPADRAAQIRDRASEAMAQGDPVRMATLLNLFAAFQRLKQAVAPDETALVVRSGLVPAKKGGWQVVVYGVRPPAVAAPTPAAPPPPSEEPE